MKYLPLYAEHMAQSYTLATFHGDVMTPQELYERKLSMNQLLEDEQNNPERLNAKAYMRINQHQQRQKDRMKNAREAAAQQRLNKTTTAERDIEALKRAEEHLESGVSKKKVVVAEGE
jgi:phosphopentomutase